MAAKQASRTQRRAAGLCFLGNGIVFLAIASTGRLAFLGVGLAMLGLGIAFLAGAGRGQ